MRPAMVAALSGAFLAIAFAASGQSSTPTQVSGQVDWSHKSDGDTFRLKDSGHRIRVWGIDAPESAQPCFTAEGVRLECGAAAQQELQDIIGDASIECAVKDVSYGRLVSQCTVNGQDLARLLVERGQVIAYLTYTQTYKTAAIQACNEKRGIWGYRFEVPSSYRGRGYPQGALAEQIPSKALRGEGAPPTTCNRQSYL